MLSKEEITTKLTQIIIQKLGVKPEDVKPAANFADDLKADSLDMVELVMAIEEEFSIDIPDSTLEDISIVSDAIDYISKHKD